MRFRVATNWDERIISKVKNTEVVALFGKLSSDFIGGARSSTSSPYVSKRQVAAYIQKAHEAGLGFMYPLSSSCLDNKEFTQSGKKQIRRLLDWLVRAGVDSVSVAIPYIFQLIKKYYPQLKVGVSAVAGVDSLKKAKFWEDLGVDEITLSTVGVNRDFPLLREIRKYVKCKLILIANAACFNGCSIMPYHYNTCSHASQSTHNLKGFWIDYCALLCRFRVVVDPTNFIRALWIRPEDVHYYEEIGIDELKLLDRIKPTESICRTIDAYLNRCYNGNLADLFLAYSVDDRKVISRRYTTLLQRAKNLLYPNRMSLSVRMQKILAGISSLLYVDNQKLEGFLTHFLKGTCRLCLCEECKYCEKVAKRVIKFDPKKQLDIIKEYEEFINYIY